MNDDDPAVLRALLSEARRERDALVVRARMLRAERDAALARGAELERVALHAASDLQPVVALFAAGGVLGDTAETLVRRAFDALAEAT